MSRSRIAGVAFAATTATALLGRQLLSFAISWCAWAADAHEWRWTAQAMVRLAGKAASEHAVHRTDQGRTERKR